MFAWTHHDVRPLGFWSGTDAKGVRAVLRPGSRMCLVVVWGEGERPRFRTAANAVEGRRVAGGLAAARLERLAGGSWAEPLKRLWPATAAGPARDAGPGEPDEWELAARC